MQPDLELWRLEGNVAQAKREIEIWSKSLEPDAERQARLWSKALKWRSTELDMYAHYLYEQKQGRR